MKRIASFSIVFFVFIFGCWQYAIATDDTHMDDHGEGGHAHSMPATMDSGEEGAIAQESMDPKEHDMADHGQVVNHDEMAPMEEAHSGHQMEMEGEPHTAESHAQMVAETPEELVSSVTIQDKSGQKVALDTHFLDENGTQVTMGELIDRPTIVLPIFFHCPVVCPLLLSSLAEGVRKIPFKEGVDYNIIALSFNDTETPDVAKNAKANYLHLLPDTFDQNAWRFLTGTKENIAEFTDSMGFRFKKTAHNTFVHPNGLAIIDENGTIIRYIYGTTFLGADMGMAISEAQSNTPGTSIKRLISVCFNYDSEGREYIAIAFKVIATLTIVGLGIFFMLFLRRSGPSNRSKRDSIKNNQDNSKSKDKTQL